MSKFWGLFWASTALAMVVAALLIWGDVDAATVIGAALGFVAFFWIVVVVTVPWNLYFSARQAQHRIVAVRGRDIAVTAEREEEVRALAKRLLFVAVGAHVVSAVVAAAVALVSGYSIAYLVAGFFLVSIVLRPAGAYFGYLRYRIAAMSRDISYPPDDVLELRTQITAMSEKLDALETSTAAWQASDARQIDDLRGDVRRQDERARAEQRTVRETVAHDHADLLARADAVDQRMTKMTVRFDAALDGVTDQQEILAGLRAFARLMREAPQAG
ncbi:hypothetical protein [Nocardia sp. XZ_19_385]|uniref:hypothetical protein n=1 Tax=Nocardia sp. XZ_19_385 TaxID=2769488 RepID=UPI00188EB259|nr:hypothetical protein [Nocardia sp. XZ_19_385]